jgi:hypothetical protein
MNSKLRNSIQWNEKLKINEYTQRRITFGKHIGTQIKDIPIDYIKWGIQNLNTEWATMFARELQRREYKWRKIESKC